MKLHFNGLWFTVNIDSINSFYYNVNFYYSDNIILDFVWKNIAWIFHILQTVRIFLWFPLRLNGENVAPEFRELSRDFYLCGRVLRRNYLLNFHWKLFKAFLLWFESSWWSSRWTYVVAWYDTFLDVDVESMTNSIEWKSKLKIKLFKSWNKLIADEWREKFPMNTKL